MKIQQYSVNLQTDESNTRGIYKVKKIRSSNTVIENFCNFS